LSFFSSVITELKSYLQGETFTKDVIFSDGIIPRSKVQTLGATITGTLYPSIVTRERQNRSGVNSIYTVNLAISKKVTPGNDAEVDGLMDLVEEIATSLDETATASGRVLSVSIDPVFDFERLRETNVFTSLIQIEMRGF